MVDKEHIVSGPRPSSCPTKFKERTAWFPSHLLNRVSPLPDFTGHPNIPPHPSDSAHRGLVADTTFHHVLVHLALHVDGALADPAGDHGSAATVWRCHGRVGWGILSRQHGCLAALIDPTKRRKPLQEKKRPTLKWERQSFLPFSSMRNALLSYTNLVNSWEKVSSTLPLTPNLLPSLVSSPTKPKKPSLSLTQNI